MSFSFTAVDAELEAVLKAALPEWKIQDAANGSAANPLVPVLSYLQTDVSEEWPGTGLMAEDYFAVSFELVLSVPEKDLIKGSKRLMSLLPLLFRALRGITDLQYDAAKKAVDAAGPFYTIPVLTLTQYSEEE